MVKTSKFSDELIELSAIAKALSHPARLAILKILAERDECVCGELVANLPLAQATVSQHLKELKQAGLIKGEISGPRSCYCINHEVLSKVFHQLDVFSNELNDSGSKRCC
ncbi:MAG: ArsR/SmtB family transcription factor [Flavobacteriales bacterium]